jgi:hypothetical protein
MALFLGFKPVPIGPRRAAASRLAQVSSKPTELLSWLLAVRLMPSVWRQFLTEGRAASVFSLVSVLPVLTLHFGPRFSPDNQQAVPQENVPR